MPEPVIIAVPPKGGSLDDVLKRLVAVDWVEQDLVAEIRRLVKEDKRRIKLEEGLIELWRDHHGDRAATMRAADKAGHDLDAVDEALERMRRYTDEDGTTQLSFAPKRAVNAILDGWRRHEDAVTAEAAMTLHLELDLGRFGRPTRIMFDHLEFTFARGGRSVSGALVGTEHEVTPSYLRKHKRDISLTCYDAFHNTLLDALDTGKVHNWHELMEHLIEANTDVRILGSLGLDDYLGHFVLMPVDRARQIRDLDANPAWGYAGDPKVASLATEPVLVDAQYEAVYQNLLDASDHGIRFENTTEDIERLCSEGGRTAIYIVRSGRTVACTPNLAVVGGELVTSETIVAVNQERLEAHPGVDLLVESLAPSADDHSSRWRDKLHARLGEQMV